MRKKLGSFLHAIVEDQPPPAKKNTKSKKAVSSNPPEHKDIRSFFGNAARHLVAKKLRQFALTNFF